MFGLLVQRPILQLSTGSQSAGMLPKRVQESSRSLIDALNTFAAAADSRQLQSKRTKLKICRIWLADVFVDDTSPLPIDMEVALLSSLFKAAASSMRVIVKETAASPLLANRGALDVSLFACDGISTLLGRSKTFDQPAVNSEVEHQAAEQGT